MNTALLCTSTRITRNVTQRCSKWQNCFTELMRNFFKNGSNEGRLQCLTRRELLSGLRPICVSPKRSKEWTPIGTGDEKHTRIMGKRPSRPDI